MGGHEHADRRLTDAQRSMGYRSNHGAMIGSVVVVRERHSCRGAGRHTCAALRMERMMSSRDEGWWLGVVWSMWVRKSREHLELQAKK